VRGDVGVQDQWNHHHVHGDEEHHEAFPSLERTRRGDAEEGTTAIGTDTKADTPKYFHRQRDADELGDDDQEIEQEDRADRDIAPATTNALSDESAVTDAGHGTETYHHLLVHDQDRYQQGQRPEQRVAEVLTGLGVRRDAAGVVVAHHDDESWSNDRQEREEACTGTAADSRFVLFDGAESTLDLILRCFAHASSFLFS